MSTDYEKLGLFYLGRRVDPETGETSKEPLLYDSKDLTTHAVCVGMTGSGKTGLCLSILEEAAIDGVPAIAIDPKGDIGNLLLTFPELRPEDFRPWIDEAEAARHGRTPDEEAARTAEAWREGLAEWDQDGSRIARFRAAADVAVYTPGSGAGRPISVLRSLAPPSAAVAGDPDAARERVSSAASGLLALLGMEADPIRSREHVLLATILDRAWAEGRTLDLPSLVREIQSPPFDRVGVLDLEAYYPAKERADLAMRLNALLAAPGFAAWTEGEPLDVARLLRTPEGKPRISILHVAHLSDAERMSFVTLVLNEVVAWTRAQSGTSSLRALLYMDEIFGFFPPTAVPPSKPPMLTLLKQARAVGLGVVLATQNPVDLDYKGLSNCGTWFLGRLQTERDKARVVEGLEGASLANGRGFDRGATERLLAGLGKRVFLMNNVHEDEPVLFRTRWALSYLRGPLTRDQLRLVSGAAAGAPAARAAAPGPAAGSGGGARPVVPPDVPEVFLPSPAGGRVAYRPGVLASARLHYVDAKTKVDAWRTVHLLAPLSEDGDAPEWPAATELSGERPDVRSEPEPGASFAPLPAAATRATSHAAWKKALAEHLYRERPLELASSPDGKLRAAPGESESDFRARLEQARRERRDLEVERLRAKHAPRLASLGERIRRAEERVEREKTQYGQQRMQTGISFFATILGAILGRKAASYGTVGRATTTARGAGRTMKERQDVAAAAEDVEALKRQAKDLEAEFEAEVRSLVAEYEAPLPDLHPLRIAPRKADITIEPLALAWIPA